MTMKKAIFNISLMLLFIALSGCGAYFNTFYNAKKMFNTAENKRLEQEKKTKKAGQNNNTRRRTRVSEYSKAIEKGSKVLELYPNSHYVDDAIMIIGQSFYHTGEYIKAQRKFEELITLLPNSEFVPKAKLWLGKTLIALNNFSQAKTVLNELVAQNVDKHLSGEAQMLLGELYYSQKDYEAAIKEFSNTVKKVGDRESRITAQMRIGQCYIELNDYKMAAEMFRQGLDLKPDLEQKYIIELNYGQALRKIREYDKALKVFRKMTREALTKSESASIRLEIAQTLIEKGETEKAKLDLEDIIRNYPKTDQSARAYYKLGYLAWRQEGEFSKALEDFNLALQEMSRSSIRDSLTFWLKNMKEWDELHFETSVYKKAFANFDPASTDTSGNYVITENIENEDFEFPDLSAAKDSTKLDSLRQLAIRDSVRADSLRRIGKDPSKTSLTQTEEYGASNKRRSQNLVLGNQPKSTLQNQGKQKKVAKKVTVPKSPAKLKEKLVTSLNKLAELYLFQFALNDSALGTYRYLLDSFPEYKLYPHWLYSTSFIYNELGDSLKADSLEQVILNDYPQSEYTVQIRRKLHLEPIENKKDPAADLFNRAENYLFEQEMIDSSIYVYEQILEKYPESEYAPKSLYSIAYIYDWIKNDTTKALQNYRELIADYPGTDYALQGTKKINAVKEMKKRALKAVQDSLKKITADSLRSVPGDSLTKVEKSTHKLPANLTEDPLDETVVGEKRNLKAKLNEMKKKKIGKKPEQEVKKETGKKSLQGKK